MEKFLLHACCAPCSIIIIDELKNRFALTVFFYNPNIYPEEEYLKRKAEVVKICREWGVLMIDKDQETSATPPACQRLRRRPMAGRPDPLLGKRGVDYDQAKWAEAVRGLEDEPEMGGRCPVCINLRLEKAAAYAAQNGFEYFGTSLTMGRNKKAEVIHPLGEALSQRYGLKFYAEDWKKQGRQAKAQEMVQEWGIYRQNYCGCKYSKIL